MSIEIKVPLLSESVSEATLGTWHKQVGEMVNEGENLIDIETDKVVMELPATKSGVLTKIIKGNGELVHSDEVIAYIDSDAPATIRSEAKKTDSEQSIPALMPAAQKIAADHSVNSAELLGTGRGGRITKGDVLKAVEVVPDGPTEENKPEMIAGGRPEKRVAMTRIRQRIAERLLQSQQNAAILTTFNEVNMLAIIELRNRYKDAFEKKHGVRMGFMSFFVKASILALQKFPIVNASVDGNDIIYHGYFDIGVAIGSERGLMVPIIRDADKLTLAGIERKISDFSARAKVGSLTIDELTGGTFSISNGGVYGSMLSTPILNPPQSAILGIHATKDRPVVENGQIVIRPINYLAVSYDHRIIDGRDAVQFLSTIKETLEFPGKAILDL